MRLATGVFTCLLIPVVSIAQTPATPLRIAASSLASVEVHLNARRIGNSWYEEDASLSGPSRIAIAYGQPHARGRNVEGGLIPLDSVWRFGANMATTLHTDLDITLGDLKLPRGDYSLFIMSRSVCNVVAMFAPNRQTLSSGISPPSTSRSGT